MQWEWKKKTQGCCSVHFQENPPNETGSKGCLMISEFSECCSHWFDGGRKGGIFFLFTIHSPKELFNHKSQPVPHWKVKRNQSVVKKNQLSGPSRELTQEAFFYYNLAHPGVWLISAFMPHWDVLVSPLGTVWSSFLLLSWHRLHFLVASSALLNAAGASGSRPHLGSEKRVAEPKWTALVNN